MGHRNTPSNQIRLLMVAPELISGNGGIRSYCRQLASLITREFKENEVHIVTQADTTASDPFIGSATSFCTSGKFTGTVRKIYFLWLMIRGILLRHPTCVICCHVNFTPYVSALCKLRRIPFVVVSYGIDSWDIQSKPILQALRSADSIVPISDFTAKKLVAQGIKKESLSPKIPGSVEDNRFFPDASLDEIRARFELQESQPTLLTVCRFDSGEHRKGYDAMLEVLPALRQHYSDIRYLLVGKGPDLDRLKEKVHSLELTQQVKFCGFVSDEDLRKLYSLATLFCMPSSKEGQGLVYLEALCCGTPVIVGAGDAGPEVLFSKRAGVAVDPENQAELIESCLSVLRQGPPDMAARKALHAEVLAAFSPEEFARQWSSVIRRSACEPTV